LFDLAGLFDLAAVPIAKHPAAEISIFEERDVLIPLRAVRLGYGAYNVCKAIERHAPLFSWRFSSIMTAVIVAF
jgi:hypothetical protein